MNILLLNPPGFRQVEEYDLPTWQHLGIGRLSSYVRQFGHKVTLIDAKLQRLSVEQVLAIIKEIKPDVVGLTVMTPDVYNAYRIARKVKEIDKGIATIIGGCHATAMPEFTLKEEPTLDYLVIGEGERALNEVLDVLAGPISKDALLKIKGIVFRVGKDIIRTEARPWDTHIEELLAPDWQLHPYATHYQLETSRGCPFIGVESGNPEVLRRSKKNIKLEEVINAVRLTRKAGVESFLSFILGHSDEKLEEMVDTVNFAVCANPNIASIGTMVPYPGTEIAEIVKSKGGNYRLLSGDWTEYNRQFSYVLELNDVSKRDMDKLQLIGTLKLHLYNRRISDLMKFIFKYRRQALQFFKMLFLPKTEKGGNISPSRISFWKLAGIFF